MELKEMVTLFCHTLTQAMESMRQIWVEGMELGPQDSYGTGFVC